MSAQLIVNGHREKPMLRKSALPKLVIIAVAAFRLWHAPAAAQGLDYVNSSSWGAMAGNTAWRVEEKKPDKIRNQPLKQKPSVSAGAKTLPKIVALR
jgi:hypothetical protein